MRILALVIGMLGVAAQDAGDWQTARTQALEHRLAGRTPQAITLLEAAVARWPTEAEAHYELGEAVLETAWLAGGTTTPEGTSALERAARHFRQTLDLGGDYRQVAAVKLVTVYDEGGLSRPADVEPLARELVERDPTSTVWPIKLAHSQAAQARCPEAARTLLAARARSGADERLLLGMTMTDLMLKCPDMDAADARPLLEGALAIAEDVLAENPANRDAVMLQSASADLLARQYPEGPERRRFEALASAAFDRFMELNPNRQAEPSIDDVPPPPPPLRPPDVPRSN